MLIILKVSDFEGVKLRKKKRKAVSFIKPTKASARMQKTIKTNEKSFADCKIFANQVGAPIFF